VNPFPADLSEHLPVPIVLEKRTFRAVLLLPQISAFDGPVEVFDNVGSIEPHRLAFTRMRCPHLMRAS